MDDQYAGTASSKCMQQPAGEHFPESAAKALAGLHHHTSHAQAEAVNSATGPRPLQQAAASWSFSRATAFVAALFLPACPRWWP